MELKNLLIGTVLVAMIILGSTLYLNGIKTSYSQNIDLSGFNATESRLYKIENMSANVYSNATGFSDWSSSGGIVGFLYASIDLMRAGWGGLTIVFQSIGLFFDILHDTISMLSSDLLGFTIPGWVWGGIMAILFILLFMMLLEMFMRWKFQT